jgi:hypothetical protein
MALRAVRPASWSRRSRLPLMLRPCPSRNPSLIGWGLNPSPPCLLALPSPAVVTGPDGGGTIRRLRAGTPASDRSRANGRGPGQPPVDAYGWCRAARVRLPSSHGPELPSSMLDPVRLQACDFRSAPSRNFHRPMSLRSRRTMGRCLPRTLADSSCQPLRVPHRCARNMSEVSLSYRCTLCERSTRETSAMIARRTR